VQKLFEVLPYINLHLATESWCRCLHSQLQYTYIHSMDPYAHKKDKRTCNTPWIYKIYSIIPEQNTINILHTALWITLTKNSSTE